MPDGSKIDKYWVVYPHVFNSRIGFGNPFQLN